VILPAAAEFAPQPVLISAGSDAHGDDPLGQCLLKASSFAHMACHVGTWPRRGTGPVGAVLDGGYNVQALPECTMATTAAMAGVGTAVSAARMRS
jgi:acetoin utilization deacetylase AcuC-like enzyme